MGTAIAEQRDTLRSEAIQAVRTALEHLENPNRDAATEVSRAHGVLGLLKQKAERLRQDIKG
jgi:hypothetical protein